MVGAGFSSVFPEHGEEVLLLVWPQEGRVFGIAWNAKETDADTHNGYAAFDYKDPNYKLAVLRVGLALPIIPSPASVAANLVHVFNCISQELERLA